MTTPVASSGPDAGPDTGIVIGLSAVIVAVLDSEGVVLTVRGHDDRGQDTLAGLPFGPFDPDGRRTFELALRPLSPKV